MFIVSEKNVKKVPESISKLFTWCMSQLVGYPTIIKVLHNISGPLLLVGVTKPHSCVIIFIIINLVMKA